MKKIFVYLKKDYPLNNFSYLISENTVGLVTVNDGILFNKDFVKCEFVNGIVIEKISTSMLEPFAIEQTGDSYEFKVCNVCGRRLPTLNFDKNQNGKGNRTIRRPACQKCREVIDGKEVPANKKQEWEKKKPNFEIWTCPICNKTTIPGVNSKVVLDHNHVTGEPREWICDSCNTGLGRFKDDTRILKNAISYLDKHSKN